MPNLGGMLAYLLGGSAGLSRGIAEQDERDRLNADSAATRLLQRASFVNAGGRFGPIPPIPTGGLTSDTQPGTSLAPGLPPSPDPTISSPPSGISDGTPIGTPAPRDIMSTVLSNGAPTPLDSYTAPRPFRAPPNPGLYPAQAAPPPFTSPRTLSLSPSATDSASSPAGAPVPAPSLPSFAPSPNPSTASSVGAPVRAMDIIRRLANGNATPDVGGAATTTSAGSRPSAADIVASAMNSMNQGASRYVGLGNGAYLDLDQAPSAVGERARLAEIALQNQGRVSVADVRASAGQLAAALRAGDQQAAADALRDMGLSDDDVALALYSKGMGNRVIGNVLPSPSARDPNISAASATNRALQSTNSQIAQTTRTIPKFNPMSLNPRADSTSVIGGRTAPLLNLGDLMARRDSLSSAYDQQSSAIGSGQRASGAVDVSGMRAQVADGQTKLNAILSNPSAPLSVKAQAQDAFRDRLQSLGVTAPPGAQ